MINDFEYICEITPVTNADGKPIEYFPYKRYKNIANKKLHKYGKGPFCKFRIPDNINKAGVYIIKIGDKIKYIGECKDLSERFNSGYGQVSPRNCFIGGQVTNCKINSHILQEIKKGSKVHLLFYETENRILLEEKLIKTYKPEWNGTSDKVIRKSEEVTKNEYEYEKVKKEKNILRMGKYDPLKDFLKNCNDNSVKLTYKEIEKIIDNVLPDSAYKYREWWANEGHVQANAWLDAGWKVYTVDLGNYVVFMKESER